MKGNSFGTLPNANNAAKDKSTTSWNVIEHTPIEKLDEHHKLQKQKYEALKAQNKPIRYERSATWYFMLDKKLQHFENLMACDEQVDIYG